jgi:hypothetical protein
MKKDIKKINFGEKLMIRLICPTKDRPNNVLKLVKNLQETVSSAITIIFVYDKEEKTPLYDLKEVKENVSICILSREHSDYLNRDYYNYAANQSLGEYIWCIGDDITFLTKGWDLILKEKIEEYLKNKTDRIAYISVNEKGSKAKHPCFPLITREAFNATGMYFHPELMSWGADRCLWELYNGINRVLYIPEIEIEHLSYHDGKAEFDETAKSMRERFFRNPNCHNEVSKNIIPAQIKRLEKIINGVV